MAHSSTIHESLTAVFQVRRFPVEKTAGQRVAVPASGVLRPCPPDQRTELAVLLWERALDPQKGTWSLPGGRLRDDEDLDTSARRQLAEKVDVRELAHLEQLSVFSDPHRVPGPRRIASAYLGLVPLTAEPELPDDTAWHPVSALPTMSFDHGIVVEHARTRLAAKLSYTNIAFALAPATFTMSVLREIYCAALGYDVDTTNLQRVLHRRKVITPTGATAAPGRAGGRPAAVHRFTDSGLRVTDEFAALRPPT
ncbi:NUDIX hydrolase [Nocardia farcinica]|uniref:Bifunctional nicotinamide mononucleotide adenylyltransferase/ADP-ribose pyrophosphatase n=1 Tax=Nocardia farcinica TaxID=37329 RepID=A0A0H5NQ45_NOCFR|nr:MULTISPECIES: NUDIX domain-containing protein [Nocardia]AXK85559.1 NUDIX hydrolase [Nocardia farcinica]MBA4856033.1 NUDIX hydrolase [Nocardia farcinica]MBC9818654.1 NUDIX hydrolase [Nocardia farcinica]MBF6071206.1 NUDIX hydrolase [Nocardia farcinica]MBF6142485.1 NUDIX hydrolase [Nocardia farcinica]